MVVPLVLHVSAFCKDICNGNPCPVFQRKDFGRKANLGLPILASTSASVPHSECVNDSTQTCEVFDLFCRFFARVTEAVLVELTLGILLFLLLIFSPIPSGCSPTIYCLLLHTAECETRELNHQQNPDRPLSGVFLTSINADWKQMMTSCPVRLKSSKTW